MNVTNKKMLNGEILTFWLSGQLFGIPVDQVQEVSSSLRIDPVPLAVHFIQGLINLRGQIILGIDLKAFFGIKVDQSRHPAKSDSIVCDIDGQIFSFQVDSVGDVIHCDQSKYELIPENVTKTFKDNCLGLYKLPEQLLFILDLKQLKNSLNQSNESTKSNTESQSL